MFTIISPAKRISISNENKSETYTIPEHLDKSEVLVKKLRKYSTDDLQKVMKINSKIAVENQERFIRWNKEFSTESAKQALLAYSGDVFQGIKAKDLDTDDLLFTQKHLSILSGLHGALRPLDLIMPYRLEIGIKMRIGKHENLYAFWKKTISDQVLNAIQGSGSNILLNLASNEYFKAIDKKKLNDTQIITPEFKEYKNGDYKFVGVLGKKARGYMVRYIIKNRIDTPEEIKLFDTEGYEYNDRLSTENNWVFTRG